MIRDVHLVGIDGWEVTPQVVLTFLDLPHGQTREELFMPLRLSNADGPGYWRRVGTRDVTESIGASCPNARTTTWHTFMGHAFHLSMQPDGCRLRGRFTIAFFAEDPSFIGATFTGAFARRASWPS